jgi:hypothetical protein
MQQPDRSRWQVEDVDGVNNVAYVAESKDCAQNYPSNDRQIRFDEYSLLNFQFGSLSMPSIR